MKQNEEFVLQCLGMSEGGFVVDKGGPTDRGITQRAFDAYNEAHGLPLRSVKGISKTLAEKILVENYFTPVRFNELPHGLDYTLADYSVNSGPSRAIKDLQREIGVKADGVFGNQTLVAMRKYIEEDGLDDLIVSINERRFAFMKTLSNWGVSKNGWTTRVMGKYDGAQVDDIGVIDRSLMLARQDVETHKIPLPAREANPAKAEAPDLPQTAGKDPTSVGALVSGGGVVTAAGGVLSGIGGLDATAQIIAVVGILVALAALAYVLRHRLRMLAVGRG